MNPWKKATCLKHYQPFLLLTFRFLLNRFLLTRDAEETVSSTSKMNRYVTLLSKASIFPPFPTPSLRLFRYRFREFGKVEQKKKSWRRMFLAMMRKINSRFVDRRWEKSLSHSLAQTPLSLPLAMRWEKFAKINARRGVFLLLSRHSFPIWCASRCVCVLLSLLFCDVSPHESATRLRNASRRQCRNKIKENNLCPAGNKWKKLQKLKQKTK